MKQAEGAFDAASDRFDAAERALDAAREERAQARRQRYAARQAYEQASTAANRLARRVRELAERLDRSCYPSRGQPGVGQRRGGGSGGPLLGLRLTYHPDKKKGLVGQASTQVIGERFVSEGGMHPRTNACWPVFSQLGAGHEPAGDRWIGWTTTGCVVLLALIAGTVSYLHMHLLVELHG